MKETVEEYELLEKLANALCGLSSGQIRRGDSVAAQKELQQPFSPKRTSVKVSAFNLGSNAENRILELWPVRFYRADCLALLDRGLAKI